MLLQLFTFLFDEDPISSEKSKHFCILCLTSHEPVMYNFSTVLYLVPLHDIVSAGIFTQNFGEIFSLLFVCEHIFCFLLNMFHLHAVTNDQAARDCCALVLTAQVQEGTTCLALANMQRAQHMYSVS
jgi:hypothetical protein